MQNQLESFLSEDSILYYSFMQRVVVVVGTELAKQHLFHSATGILLSLSPSFPLFGRCLPTYLPCTYEHRYMLRMQQTSKAANIKSFRPTVLEEDEEENDGQELKRRLL